MKKNAFTLIELLIVLGISMLLVVISIPIYSQFQIKAQMNDASAQMIQNIRSVRGQSLAGVEGTNHGIYLQIDLLNDDSYILYEGETYATRNVNADREFKLESVLSLSTNGFTKIGENVDINFQKITGTPNESGTITLGHEVFGSRTLQINSIGTIEEI